MNAKTVLSLFCAGIATITNPITSSETALDVTQNVTYEAGSETTSEDINTNNLYPTLYPICGIVTEVTSEKMTFTDFIAAIMDDNGTPIIYDDIVISTKYCGWEY